MAPPLYFEDRRTDGSRPRGPARGWHLPSSEDRRTDGSGPQGQAH